MKKVLLCLDLTKYAYKKLKILEKELKLDLWVTRSHKYALTVLFRRPNDKIVFKYTLSSEKLLVNDGEMLEERLYSHIYLMEHITYAKIDELIEDLRQSGAFPFQDTVRAPENVIQLQDSHSNTAEIPNSGQAHS